MNSEKLKEILSRVPWTILLLGYLGYQGFDYYNFVSDPTSPLGTRMAAVEAETAETRKLDKRLAEAEAFSRKLEEKKVELQDEVLRLEATRATLSETLDVPAFMTTVYTEARRTGLSILSLKPGDSAEKEFYAEQAFEMTFRGVFAQLVSFLDRVSNLQRIVRVENYAMHPVTSSGARFVELEGKVQLKVYRYLGSAADRIGKKGEDGKKGDDGKGGSSGSSPGSGARPAGAAGGGA